MGKQIQLNIPMPCHEDWDAMDNTAKGKFCGSCQKHVIDFTNMSDRQLAEFFKKPSTGNVCGRFMGDQLDRAIDIPKKRIPWLKYFFTIAIPAFFASKAAGQQLHKKASSSSPLVTRPIIKKDTVVLPEIVVEGMRPVIVARTLDSSGVEKTDIQKALAGKVAGPVVSTYNPAKNSLENRLTGPELETTKRTITGIILDEKGEPVPHATIVIRGTKTGVVANTNGEFRLLAETGNVLAITGVAINMTEITIGDKSFLSVYATPREVCGREVIMGILIRRPDNKKIEKQKEKSSSTEIKTTQQPKQPTLHIFPNPVMANSSITIKLPENNDEGYYTCIITALSGQNLYEQQLWIDKTAKVFSLDIPSIPAGTYNFSLVNKVSGKSFAEKMVVQ